MSPPTWFATGSRRCCDSRYLAPDMVFDLVTDLCSGSTLLSSIQWGPTTYDGNFITTTYCCMFLQFHGFLH